MENMSEEGEGEGKRKGGRGFESAAQREGTTQLREGARTTTNEVGQNTDS